VSPPHYFDSASTTPCEPEVVSKLNQYALENFGNPSSSHLYGQKAARALREARHFFAHLFRVQPEQVIFTSGGTEANNLALYGIAFKEFISPQSAHCSRLLISAIEHASVKKPAESLKDFGMEVVSIPIDRAAQIDSCEFEALVSQKTRLVSIQQVNPIVGTHLPVEKLAIQAKKLAPQLVFHTDAVQAFGKVDIPQHPSPVDLVSLSAHKIGGPKGVGALIVLNKNLLQPHSVRSPLRPLLWGGDQENGFRSGTQNPGLIAGFHLAAQMTLQNKSEVSHHFIRLNQLFQEKLDKKGLPIQWNSPAEAVPSIISLSIPGIPSSVMAQLLEERNCLVSVGSACSSKKPEPEPVLRAMGKPLELQTSGIRISFLKQTQLQDIETLANALEDSIRVFHQLNRNKRKP